MRFWVYHEDPDGPGGVIPSLVRTIASPVEAANPEDAILKAVSATNRFTGYRTFVVFPEQHASTIKLYGRETVEYSVTPAKEATA